MTPSTQTYHVPAQHSARYLWLIVVLWVFLHPLAGLARNRFIDPLLNATSQVVERILPDTRHYDDQIDLPIQDRLAQVLVESSLIAVCLAVLPALIILGLFPQHRSLWLRFLLLSWLVAGLTKHLLGGMLGLYYGIYFFQPAPITAPFVGVALGLIQMRFFRRYTSQAYIWLLGTTVAYVLGELVYEVIVTRYLEALIDADMTYLLSMSFWSSYGLITGLTLWWLLRGMQFDAQGKALPLVR